MRPPTEASLSGGGPTWLELAPSAWDHQEVPEEHMPTAGPVSTSRGPEPRGLRGLQVARLLRAVRAEVGISQGELGRRAGIHHQTLYRIERGLNRPDTLAALSLLEALPIPVPVMRAAVMDDADAVDRFITEELGERASSAIAAWETEIAPR